MQNSNLNKLGNKISASVSYDPLQLEKIERLPRRLDYSAPMNGYDIWTCFEISHLLENKLPTYYILRILNPANSKNIFESKSLKLYLNSFNNTVFKNKEEAIRTIQIDLSKLTEANVIVQEMLELHSSNFLYERSFCLEEEVEDIEITQFTYLKNLLSTINYVNQGEISISMYSNLLRSNCEITGSPDFARIYINYIPDKLLINRKSLLQYIISYRNHNEFHEPTCERIYNDLFELIKPKELTVLCQYTRRGGIDINPYRSTKEVDYSKVINIPKLLQQ